MKIQKAQNLIDYALILVLVILVAITVLSYLGKRVDYTFQDMSIDNYNIRQSIK